MPPQFTTTSDWMSPNSVLTPVTLPLSLRIAQTLTSSKILTPLFFAPFAKAIATLAGSAFPSLGIHAPPTISSRLKKSNLFLSSSVVKIWTSTP